MGIAIFKFSFVWVYSRIYVWKSRLTVLLMRRRKNDVPPQDSNPLNGLHIHIWKRRVTSITTLRT